MWHFICTTQKIDVGVQDAITSANPHHFSWRPSALEIWRRHGRIHTYSISRCSDSIYYAVHLPFWALFPASGTAVEAVWHGQSTIQSSWHAVLPTMFEFCTQYGLFAAPSLMILKCYCIMTLFLLDTGQHHAACNLIGMAVRVAQSLNLDGAAALGARSTESNHLHIWWTLVHLDFRFSRNVRKTISAQFSNAISMPYRQLDCLKGLESSPYFTHRLRLS